MYFRGSTRESVWLRDPSVFTVAVYVMRLIQLRIVRWLRLGFASRRHRLGCIIVTVFVVVLILHLLTYRDLDSVSCVFDLLTIFC